MLSLENFKINTSFFVATLTLLFTLNCTVNKLFAQKKQYVVALDAGHGGHDPGNIGNGFREKNIALKVIKLVGAELNKSKDIKVVYTRQKDVFIDLWKRGEIANNAKADVFVSVHCDSHTSQAYGAGTFVLGGSSANQKNYTVSKENAVILLEDNYKERYKGFDPNSAESVIGLTLMQEENLDKSLMLAAGIQKNFKSNLKRRDRGVKQAGFVVLHQTYMPSVLVELGFLTNKKEGIYLNSKKGQQQMSLQIAKAVKSYINQLKLNTVKQDTVVKQKEVKKTEKLTTTVKVEKKDTKEVLFKVQIASSKKKIKTKSYNFKGLRNVERVKVGKYYKYYYGNSSNYETVKSALKKAKAKGYSSAFIAAFKNGEKISVVEALK